MSKPRKPKALRATYLPVARIFEMLEACRAKLERAGRVLDDPSDGLHYRDHLDSLVRLEAQVDTLAYCFGMPRRDLKKWVEDMEAYYKKLEEAA